MNIINNLQKIIFEKLQNIKENINIYSCPETNSPFPYVILNINKIEIENNFNNNIYSISLTMSVFDKNESNLNILNISNIVKSKLLELSNTKSNTFNIVDINFNNLTIKIFNEINSIWNTNLNFNITLEQII